MEEGKRAKGVGEVEHVISKCRRAVPSMSRSLTGDTTFVKQPCLLHANHVQDSAEMNWRAEI